MGTGLSFQPQRKLSKLTRLTKSRVAEVATSKAAATIAAETKAATKAATTATATAKAVAAAAVKTAAVDSKFHFILQVYRFGQSQQ